MNVINLPIPADLCDGSIQDALEILYKHLPKSEVKQASNDFKLFICADDSLRYPHINNGKYTVDRGLDDSAWYISYNRITVYSEGV